MKLAFRTTVALALVSALGIPAAALAQPVKGVAEIGITQPATTVVGKEVVTTFKVKNLSKAPIAGLKVEENWFDKSGTPSPGASKRLKEPLAPGAVVTIELRTPRTANMDKNNYQFSHANGAISAKVMKIP